MMEKEFIKHKEEVSSSLNEDEEMYRENILDHYKNPRNRKELTTCNATERELNPVCGDEITVYLEISDDKIKDVGFSGHGCAISQASISMLTEKIKGMSIEDVKKLDKDDVYKMLGIPISINRIKCALLSLKTTHGALKKYEA